MSAAPHTATDLEALTAIPDTPLSAEGRAMLLRGNALIFAGEKAGDWVLCDAAGHLIFLAGRPGVDRLRRALEVCSGAGAVIAGADYAGPVAGVLTDWTADRIHVYTFGSRRLARPAEARVSWLRPSEIATLDAGDLLLRRTLLEASRHAPIAAARMNGTPVSFCFASSQTETLWNVSIETPERFRGKRFGSACAAWLMEHYLAAGKLPVWGAAESNPASRHMAESLGLVECGQLALFQRG